jgi:branched-chain amino acid transport system permease protein
MSWFEFQSVLGNIGIYAILALSLNVICGMTGLLQLGQAGFFAIGAYAAGLTSIYLTFPELGVLNFAISAVVAMAAGGIFSIVLGIPCLRLKGDYLAITTLGFGEITRLILVNLQFPGGKMYPGEKIGGATGIKFTESPGDLWTKFPDYSAEFASWWFIWIFVLIICIVLINIKKSSFGRAMMCIREDEIAAQSMGINISKYKMIAFLLSAVTAGFAGALFFHKELAVAPGKFNLICSIEILLMIVLGGLGSFTGALTGAIVLGLTPYILRHVEISGYRLGEYQQLMYAVLLIILIRLAPNGIFGMNEIPGWLEKVTRAFLPEGRGRTADDRRQGAKRE